MRFKFELRSLLKQLVGILTSTDWQSPGQLNDIVQEKGIQSESNVYMRTGGSEFVKNYEKEFTKKLYNFPIRSDFRYSGYFTCSGMKALEIALIFAKMITKRDTTVYIQKGFYYEGISLAEIIFDNARRIDLEQIYDLLDKNHNVGTILLDPGTTWPVAQGIDLELFFNKLKNYRCNSPLCIIIDRTTTSITNQFIEQFGLEVNKNIVIISIESAIKYYQCGLDLCNLGFIVVFSSLLRFKKYDDLLQKIIYLLSGIPDSSSVMRVPNFSIDLFKRRMKIIARNTNILFHQFKILQNQGILKNINSSVDIALGYHIEDNPWIGSLIFIQVKGYQSYEDYIKLQNLIVSNCPRNLHIQIGGSFGFDSIRLTVVKDDSQIENCALRISVGIESYTDIMNKAMLFKDFFLKLISL